MRTFSHGAPDHRLSRSLNEQQYHTVQVPTGPLNAQEKRLSPCRITVQHGSLSAATTTRGIHPVISKMAPARHTTMEDNTEPGPLMQLAEDHIMASFTLPSDLSPCLHSLLTGSAAAEEDMCSPEFSTSPTASTPHGVMCYSLEHNTDEQGSLSLHQGTESNYPNPPHSQGIPQNTDSVQKLWAFLQLPTRDDLGSIAHRMETALRQEVQNIKQEVSCSRFTGYCP